MKLKRLGIETYKERVPNPRRGISTKKGINSPLDVDGNTVAYLTNKGKLGLIQIQNP